MISQLDYEPRIPLARRRRRRRRLGVLEWAAMLSVFVGIAMQACICAGIGYPTNGVGAAFAPWYWQVEAVACLIAIGCGAVAEVQLRRRDRSSVIAAVAIWFGAIFGTISWFFVYWQWSGLPGE